MTTGTAGRRARLSAAVVAVWSLGVLIILLWAADTPLGVAARWTGNGYGLQLVTTIAVLPMALVGFVVARRQPGNPLGWMSPLHAGPPGRAVAWTWL